MSTCIVFVDKKRGLNIIMDSNIDHCATAKELDVSIPTFFGYEIKITTKKYF